MHCDLFSKFSSHRFIWYFRESTEVSLKVSCSFNLTVWEALIEYVPFSIDRNQIYSKGDFRQHKAQVLVGQFVISLRPYSWVIVILISRDRLEDMRFMYDTAAESNAKISFDSVDPFYDALPWFRLIGRYARFFALATDLDNIKQAYWVNVRKNSHNLVTY